MLHWNGQKIHYSIFDYVFTQVVQTNTPYIETIIPYLCKLFNTCSYGLYHVTIQIILGIRGSVVTTWDRNDYLPGNYHCIEVPTTKW